MDTAFLVFLSSLFMCFTSSAQIKDKLDEHLKNPERKEQSAKADIYITGQNKISDTGSSKKPAAPVIRNRNKCKSIKKSYRS